MGLELKNTSFSGDDLEANVHAHAFGAPALSGAPAVAVHVFVSLVRVLPLLLDILEGVPGMRSTRDAVVVAPRLLLKSNSVQPGLVAQSWRRTLVLP
jgi:hypothetical protein